MQIFCLHDITFSILAASKRLLEELDRPGDLMKRKTSFSICRYVAMIKLILQPLHAACKTCLDSTSECKVRC